MTRIIYLLLSLIISSCENPIKPHSEPASYALKPSSNLVSGNRLTMIFLMIISIHLCLQQVKQ